MTDRSADDELPPDPELDAAPEELRLLAGIGDGAAVVISEDGVSTDTVVLVPAVWGHYRRMTE